MDPSVIARLRSRWAELYADRAEECLAKLLQRVDRDAPAVGAGTPAGWDERDVVLITYADQVTTAGEAPLATLGEFLTAHGLDRLINTLHILPFFPYSSDDGFSVIDFRAVDPAVGTWEDVRRLGESFRLMFDLVLNHVSRRSRWLEKYLTGRQPQSRFFLEVSPGTDLSQVTRPRSTPLVTPQETAAGRRQLWTTFGPDQFDLNYGEPEVLLAMIDILLLYVRQGGRIIRLDAVAYLWKQLGTSCIHLPQTHTVVKLLRDLLGAVAPGVWLLTETNVPHAENVSYFGDGDEAHMVYQFSLPPLLLDALVSGDARSLSRWLADLGETPPGTTYFNFTASHDGIGLRPLEGLVSAEHIARLSEVVAARGGLVSTRCQPDGNDSPYELNITYVDALGGPDGALHARRFLASQAVMLALQGIPGIYFHSLVGTPNDADAARRTGQARKINRRKYDLDELTRAVSSPDSVQKEIFGGYCRLLWVRRRQPAFHPDAAQQVRRSDSPALVMFLRTSVDGRQRILVVANLSDRQWPVDLAAEDAGPFSRDLVTDRPLPRGESFQLEPYQVAWLEATVSG